MPPVIDSLIVPHELPAAPQQTTTAAGADSLHGGVSGGFNGLAFKCLGNFHGSSVPSPAIIPYLLAYRRNNPAFSPRCRQHDKKLGVSLKHGPANRAANWAGVLVQWTNEQYTPSRTGRLCGYGGCTTTLCAPTLSIRPLSDDGGSRQNGSRPDHHSG